MHLWTLTLIESRTEKKRCLGEFEHGLYIRTYWVNDNFLRYDWEKEWERESVQSG